MSARAFDWLCQISTRLTTLKAMVLVQGAALSGMNERLRDLEELCEEVLDPAVQELIKSKDQNDNKVKKLVARVEALRRNPNKMVRDPVEGNGAEEEPAK